MYIGIGGYIISYTTAVCLTRGTEQDDVDGLRDAASRRRGTLLLALPGRQRGAEVVDVCSSAPRERLRPPCLSMMQQHNTIYTYICIYIIRVHTEPSKNIIDE